MSRATRPVRRRDAEGRRDTTLKWVLFCLYLSAAVVLATIGFLTPGVQSHLNWTLVYVMAGTVGVSFLGFRFRRSVGLPVTVLAIAAFVLLLLFLQSITAYTGETEIARVRVLSHHDQLMKLELVPAGGMPAIVEMQGDYFAPIVKVVIFDDVFVFLGSRTWYRFEGLTSFVVEKDGAGYRFRQADTDYYFPEAHGISEKIFVMFERYEAQLPGVKAVQVEVDLKRVRESSGTPLPVYSIRVQNDGGVQIIAE